MPSHNQVAASVRRDKEAHPEKYCRVCLWRTPETYCPRHATTALRRESECDPDDASLRFLGRR